MYTTSNLPYELYLMLLIKKDIRTKMKFMPCSSWFNSSVHSHYTRSVSCKGSISYRFRYAINWVCFIHTRVPKICKSSCRSWVVNLSQTRWCGLGLKDDAPALQEKSWIRCWPPGISDIYTHLTNEKDLLLIHNTMPISTMNTKRKAK